MQTSPRFYGLSGLIAILGVMVLIAGLLIMVLLPDIRFAAWIILVIGAILLISALIIEFRRVRLALTGRRGVFGIGTTVMASVFIGITLVINAISIGNYHRFDLTGVAQFTLTTQTKDALKELQIPVKVITFAVPDDPIGSYCYDLLSEYQNYTEQLSLTTVDPDEQPDLARQYGVSYYPSLVFESQDLLRLVPWTEFVTLAADGTAEEIEAEYAFTSAILEVSGTVQKKVYFLTGHGETDIHKEYSYARQTLMDNLYRVDTLDLSENLSIPQDTAALMIIAPRFSIGEEEFEVLQQFLVEEGQLCILINPNPIKWIDEFIYPWGIDIEDGTVIDNTSYITPNKDTPLVTGSRMIEELQPLSFFFPGATAILPLEEEIADNIGIRPLIWTTPDSWLEMDYTPDEEYEFNEGTERQGPLALGVLIVATPTDTSSSTSDKLTRLVAIGDSDFASNENFFDGNNGFLFLSMVNWLTEETEIISIERKALPFRRLVVSPDDETVIKYTSVGLVPLFVLIAGVIIWVRRR